jgi:uncharacterized membrane protein YsdA (DUF1294 family)
VIAGYIAFLAGIPAFVLIFLWHDKRAAQKQAARTFADEVESFLKGHRG